MERAPKLLFVGTLPPHRGGTAIANATLLGGLAARGVGVRTLSPITAETLDADDLADRRPGIDVSRYLVPAFAYWPATGEAGDYASREAEAIRAKVPELIAMERPDVVMAGHESFAWHVPELARAAGLPCIVLVHSGATEPFFGTARGAALLERLREADLTITVADHLAEAMRRLGVSRVESIPNPVDLDLFYPRPWPAALAASLRLDRDDRILLHVSNFKPIKRPLDLVHALAIAAREDPGLKLVMVGDGPLRGAVESASSAAGLSERVRTTGWVDHDRLPDHLALADLVVMPSEAEGQALAYLEAQACARVLVASDIPGAREVVRDGETGLLFGAGDVQGLARAIVDGVRDRARADAIGARARSVVRRHALDAVIEAYLALFERVRRGVVRHGRVLTR
ncbi:MAG: glycosyltransferase family 4 protein [Candidatus Binatia bacterium]